MRRDPLYVGPSHRKLSLPSALLMTAVGVLSKTFISLGTRHQLILLNRDNIEPLINYIPPAVRELSRYSHRKWWRWPSFLPRTQQQHHPANQNNGSMAPLEEWCHQQPLLTYTNHNSTLDDPLMWTFVSWKTVFLPWRLRWTMAADDICFHNAPLRLFFSHVQTMPITRGAGIYQPSMDHALDIMNSGGWVHIFPEGKVNSEYGETRQMLPFRWGIGRLIMESRIPPLIIPIFHVGMEQVKPPGSGAWALPKFGKRLTIAVGDPIDTRPVLESLLSSSSSSSSCQQLTKDEVRSQLTAFCRSQLEKVQRAAEQRHFTLT